MKIMLTQKTINVFEWLDSVVAGVNPLFFGWFQKSCEFVY